jgi:hypothetical protein
MKRTAYLILAGILLILLPAPSLAQLNNHLILKHGPRNVMHFLTGDSIIYMRNNFRTPERHIIQAIGEDFIIVGNEELPIKQITSIVKVRALHYKAAGTAAKISGPALILLDGVNSLIRNFRPVFSTNVAIVGAAIFGTGFLLPLLQTKVYRMDKGYYLRIVPSDLDFGQGIK